MAETKYGKHIVTDVIKPPFGGVFGKYWSLDSIRPEDLSAVQTMDMLERTFELGTVISTADSDEKGKGSFTGQLEINFVDTFDGV